MRKKIFIALGGIVLALIISSFFLGGRTVQTLSGDFEPIVLSEKDVEDIVQMVSRHMKVPNEKPNVGVVTDVSTLIQTEPFYQGAENGDVLLIYPSISRAILFDLEQDVIINVGPVVFENPEGGPAPETVN